MHAIRVVAAGEGLLAPRITRRLIADIAATPGRSTISADALVALTDREREVLVLVAGGLTNDQIADHLSLSPHTVKTHVHRAMNGLDVRDRAQLVVIAYETGLVRPGPT